MLAALPTIYVGCSERRELSPNQHHQVKFELIVMEQHALRLGCLQVTITHTEQQNAGQHLEYCCLHAQHGKSVIPRG